MEEEEEEEEEEVRSSEVGSSRKASLSEKVVIVLLAVAVKEGSGFLPSSGFSVVPSRCVPSMRVPSIRVPSRRVPTRRVRDLAIKAGAGACSRSKSKANLPRFWSRFYPWLLRPVEQ